MEARARKGRATLARATRATWRESAEILEVQSSGTSARGTGRRLVYVTPAMIAEVTPGQGALYVAGAAVELVGIGLLACAYQLAQ
jgi:hypothetical protein